MRAKLLSIFLLLLITAFPVQAATPQSARMEQVIRSYVDAKRFMGTVLVAKDNEILLDKGYGSADLEWNVANTPDTKFRLGSITKQFTAASILLLEERGNPASALILHQNGQSITDSRIP
jgi:CubicO group peptidase (beta-lactamase class C family)